MKRFFAIAFAVMAVTAISCTKNETDDPKPDPTPANKLEVSPATVATIAKTGGTFTLSVKSNVMWNVAISDGTANPVTWLTTEAFSGKNDADITFRANANEVPEARNASIKFTTLAPGVNPVEIKVSQEAGDKPIVRVWKDVTRWDLNHANPTFRPETNDYPAWLQNNAKLNDYEMGFGNSSIPASTGKGTLKYFYKDGVTRKTNTANSCGRFANATANVVAAENWLEDYWYFEAEEFSFSAGDSLKFAIHNFYESSTVQVDKYVMEYSIDNGANFTPMGEVKDGYTHMYQSLTDRVNYTKSMNEDLVGAVLLKNDYKGTVIFRLRATGLRADCTVDAPTTGNVQIRNADVGIDGTENLGYIAVSIKVVAE